MQKACSDRVRNIQEYHIRQKKYNDIGFNFLVGGDGRGYEGRSFQNVGAHTGRFNPKSIGIAFIGDFSEKVPSEAQINAAKEIIAFGVKNHFITSAFKLYGQRQLIDNDSPGDALFEIIRKWPNWAAEVVNDKN